jgi:DNA polymerase I-like protein with 3'-5' exonuclease and polymerase domains
MIYYITNQKQLFDSNLIKIEDNFDKLHNYLKDNKTTSVDTETTGLDPLTDKVLLLQIGDDVDQYIIDLTTTSISPEVKTYLESKEAKKILHHSRFDYKMLKANGICTLENVFCTRQGEQMVMNGLTDSSKRGNFSLKVLVKKYLNVELDKSTALNFTATNVVMTEKELVYAADDVKYTYLISGYINANIETYGLTHLAAVEMEANLGYGDMELNGFLLDTGKWEKIHKNNIPKYNEKQQELEHIVLSNPGTKKYAKAKGGVQTNLFEEVGKKTNINWDSPTQLLPIAREFLGGIEDTSKTSLELFVSENYATGLYEATKPEHKFAELLLNYRVYSKAVGQYGTDFFKHIHPKTGRVHPNFDPLGPDTGRVSCSKPNLQNIKAESDYRSAFVPRPGYKMVTCDYSGCELRIIAEFSGDPVWVEAFNEGQDVHSRVATLLFGKEVTKSNENKHLRSPAKNLNFGLAYGMGPSKLARQLRITDKEAKKLMQKYFTVFPAIKKFLEGNGAFAVANGCILTPPPYKRIRWFKKHKEARDDSAVRGSIERAGKNTPIQGCNADLVKKATTLVRRHIQNLPEGEMFLVNQVHDEFVFEVREDVAEERMKDIVFLMESAADDLLSKVPMVAEATLADCWQK